MGALGSSIVIGSLIINSCHADTNLQNCKRSISTTQLLKLVRMAKLPKLKNQAKIFSPQKTRNLSKSNFSNFKKKTKN